MSAKPEAPNPTTGAPERLSPLHAWHQGMGASFRSVAGWQVAASYGDTTAERRAIAAAGGLCDITAHARFNLRGEAATAITQEISQLDASSPVGATSRAILRDGKAASLAEGWLVRLRPDSWWLIVEDPAAQQAAGRWLEERAAALDCVHAVDVTSGYATLGLRGSAALPALQKLLAVDPDKLVAPMGVQTRLAGVLTLTMRMPGKDAESWLITCPRESAEYLWQVLEDAGAEYGLLPVGTEAWGATHS